MLVMLPRVRTSDALFQTIFDITADDSTKIRVILRADAKEALAYH